MVFHAASERKQQGSLVECVIHGFQKIILIGNRDPHFTGVYPPALIRSVYPATVARFVSVVVSGSLFDGSNISVGERPPSKLV